MYYVEDAKFKNFIKVDKGGVKLSLKKKKKKKTLRRGILAINMDIIS